MSLFDLIKSLFPQAQMGDNTQYRTGTASDMLDFANSWKRIMNCLKGKNCGCESHIKLKEVWEKRLSLERRELALRFAQSSLGFQFQALMNNWNEIKIKEELDKSQINTTLK